MYRNFGINYKFPRSTGGKFFQQKIDEGRSNLLQVYGLFAAATASSDVYFKWNETDLTQFGTGFFVDGGGTNNLGSASLMLATSSNAVSMPGLKLELSTNFSCSDNACYLVPLITNALPRRYTVRLGSTTTTNNGNWGFGFCFGATSASANSQNMYGNIYMFNSVSAGSPATVQVIQSGTCSAPMLAAASEKFPDDAADCTIFQFNIETVSTAGSTSGSLWRIEQEMGRGGDDATNSYYSNYSPASLSGAYGDWSSITYPLDRFFLVLKAPTGSAAAAAKRSIRIDSLSILAHPYDTRNGGVLT